MRQICISYARHDHAAVRALTEDLERGGHEVWLDQEPSGGTGWWDAVLRQIRECTVLVFALSDRSLHSAPCRAELEYARRLGVPVLPVQVGSVRHRRDQLPDGRFHGSRVFDHREGDPVEAVVLLLEIAAAAARRGPLPDPLPPPPPVPHETRVRLHAQIAGTAAAARPRGRARRVRTE